MITRKQYTNGEATHREYYGQFVTDEIRANVLKYIGKRAIKTSIDEHFNDIALHRWDCLPLLRPGVHRMFKEAGDWVSLAGAVCVYKEAARQIKEKGD